MTRRSSRRAWLTPVAAALSVLLEASARADALPTPGAAAELVREARAHEAAREDDVALRRYAEALALDPTLGDAYVGLGALRFRLGDPREAARVYDTALSRVPDLTEALLGRAHARHALGDLAAADADLAAYVEATHDGGAMRELADWYQKERRPLAQLGAWRALRALAEAKGDAAARKEARVTVHALERIVGEVDPVTEPPAEASAVRRGMARMEGRR